MTTLALEKALVDSFQDYRLSTSEKHNIKDLLAPFRCEPTQLSFIRNKAFSLVAENYHSQASDHRLTLKWLENIVRTIDSIRPVDSSKTSSYFSPGKECATKIVSLLERAKVSVDICVFTISDDKISRAILSAYKRGVEVRIISDNDKANDLGSDIYSLSKQGLMIKIDRSASHMHHKFAIVDSRYLINGSFNWTRSASNYNQENIVVMNDYNVILDFKAVFDRLWKECEPC
jgi:mitochondrial cardiolipin hydrolase